MRTTVLVAVLVVATLLDMTNVAVVTGGGGGMGLATARLLGRDHHLLLADVSEARLDAASSELIASGAHVETALCDVSDTSSVDALAIKAQGLGTVRAVVHTAGLSPTMGSAEEIVRINALGTILVNEAFLRIAEPGLSVVNVASVAGHQLPRALRPRRTYRYAFTDKDVFARKLTSLCNAFPGAAGSGLAYVTSKNFVIWYSAKAAAAFGARGGRVVSVSPGSFDTPMGRKEAAVGAEAMTKFGAVKRFGTPEEIAGVLAFCAGPTPTYLTGADIICDGGVTALMTKRDNLSLVRNGLKLAK